LHRIIFSLQLVLKFLTNYFIVSNQIVKQLRGSPSDIGFLRKTKLTTGLESRWASLSRFRVQASTGDLHPKISEPKFLFANRRPFRRLGPLENYYGVPGTERRGPPSILPIYLPRRCIDNAHLPAYQTRLLFASKSRTLRGRPSRIPGEAQNAHPFARVATGLEMRHP
jgi:hypothetical protein